MPRTMCESTNRSISQSRPRRSALFQAWVKIQFAFWSFGSMRKCWTLKCVRASTKSATPDTRIQYQTASSTPPLCGRGRPEREYSAISTLLLDAQRRAQDDECPGDAEPDEDRPVHVPHDLVVPGHRRPEIHDQDPDAV